MKNSATSDHRNGLEVAVIGTAYRFPGANNAYEFWQNLKNGVESISFFSDPELEASVTDPAVLNDPRYVKAGAIVEGVELFDADFFGYSPREAELIDPQHRLFLECAWEALEGAGYDSETYTGLIGVYAGASLNTYLLSLFADDDLKNSLDPLQAVLANDKDFLTTRVSYKLNLEGPSVTVQSACSTALVAIHLAYQSLLSGDCDMALAGAASIRLPQKAGYFSAKGGILSPDGHCRVFDAKARGTVRGNGVGIVVLKRLTDALADGDSIYAVIKGSAINNDGGSKIGFTAPRADGQAKVIQAAHLVAGIEPETIGYVEAHGTGTELGDPIEVEALTKAFRTDSERKNFCAIGSVKSNIGHLDATAGVAGFIKTVLTLKHRLIPPSLNFEEPNPRIDFKNSPFYVNTRPREWEAAPAVPRRAGVSSFGMGGTNAHVVLEEAPEVEASGESRPWQILMLSARTERGLEEATKALATQLRRDKGANLADVAYTLAVGRRAFSHRRVLVCSDTEDAITSLEKLDPERVFTAYGELRPRQVALMFSGQGAQYTNMARDLYQSEPVFREQIDHCSELLKPDLGLDLRAVLYPTEEQTPTADSHLAQTSVTQPALFVIEYALARLLMRWGIHPTAMIGHSIGEYVAACLAGVFSLEACLSLVATRGRLMHQLPGGAMLSVRLAEEEVRPLLRPELSIAAINGPSFCVVSGPAAAIKELQSRLAQRAVKCSLLRTSHAFHSEMMDPVLESFVEEVKEVELNPPQIPIVSNVSGTWITSEATDPIYWARHLRQTVRFSDGLGQLLREPDRILLEVGPGDTLSAFARQHPDKSNGQIVMGCLRHPEVRQSDSQHLLTVLGRLWLSGLKVDWPGFYAHERRYRIALPTYPFERKRYWIEPRASFVRPNQEQHLADWFYAPLWKESDVPTGVEQTSAADQKACWLLFIDDCGLGSQLAQRLERSGQDVKTVVVGSQFERLGHQGYAVNPTTQDDYDALVRELLAEGKQPARIIHLWTVTANNKTQSLSEWFEESQYLGFYSLLFLAQALGRHKISQPLHLAVVSNNMQKVAEESVICPEKATILGPCKVIPLEYPNITCQSIDVLLAQRGSHEEELLLARLVDEVNSRTVDPAVAFRQGRRWIQTFEPVQLNQGLDRTNRLRERGTYLITGGLGGIGLVFAEELARRVHARLVLVGRSDFPPKDGWERWLDNHDDLDVVSRRIRHLQAIERLGAEILVARADVADREQMEATIKRAKDQFGEIHGVIHAAGIAGDGVIQLKTAEKAASVLASKTKGTLVVEDLFKDTKLDFLVLCSSLSSVHPPLGQVDYCAANAFLDAFAHHQAAKQTAFTVSINWDRWKEAGMAVEAQSNVRTQHFDRLFQADETHHPLLEKCVLQDPDQQIYMTEFSVDKYWFLSEHRIMQKATVPGTVYLEMARAAFERHARSANIQIAAIELTDVTFFNPLVLADDERRQVRTVVKKHRDLYDVRFMSQSGRETDGQAGWQEHARLKIASVNGRKPRRFEISNLLMRCNEGEINVEGRQFSESKQKQGAIYLGPRWQAIKQIRLGANEAVAILELGKDFLGDLEEYKLHPSLVDIATSATTLSYMNQTGGSFYLPLWYKRLTVRGTITGRVFSYIKDKHHSDSRTETIRRDVVILDENGRELVEIEDFALKRVPDDLVSEALAGERPSDADPDATPMRVPAAQGETDPELGLNHGLLSSEGAQALMHVLSQGRPQVLVSTLPLLQRIETMSALKGSRVLDVLQPSARAKHLHPRPTLASTYVAPRNKVEQAIAGIWQDLLGIERIGIHDNFFELGGNSLMGIEVVASVGKLFDVDIPVVSLYEGSTVGSMAGLINVDEKHNLPLDERRTRGERRRARMRQRTQD